MAWSLSFPSSIPSQLNPELIFKLTTTFSTPHLLPKKGNTLKISTSKSISMFSKNAFTFQSKRKYVSSKT